MALNTIDDPSDELTLGDVIVELWKNKFLIVISSVALTILFIIYAFLLPNIYTSKALLISKKSEDFLSSQLGSLSAYASYANINIPNDSVSKIEESIKKIKSFDFFSEHFLPYVEIEDIIAAKSWDHSTNTIIYDSSQFDVNSKKWIRDFSYPQKQVPSAQELYEYYLDESFLSISYDADSVFVNISVSHVSPIIAYSWLQIIIREINERMRLDDINAAKKNIAFLNEYQQSNNIQFLKESSSNLLENQMQTLMLASSDEAYVFKVLDPPIIPEDNSRPNRLFIILIGLFLSVFVSFSLVFLNKYKDNLLSKL